MFKCKVCAEKENRIADLKAQIAFLQQQLNPPPRVTRYELEADSLLNGGGGEIQDNPDTPPKISQEAAEQERKEQELIMIEREQILNGNLW